jgi:hypothetical protein
MLNASQLIKFQQQQRASGCIAGALRHSQIARQNTPSGARVMERHTFCDYKHLEQSWEIKPCASWKLLSKTLIFI